jgi:predicted TPR repeat methyltransferase
MDASDVENEVPLYDDLLVLDLEEMNIENTLALNHNSGISGFDLVVAADVLVYFGSVAKLLKTFSNISTPGAALIFTCERATEEEAPLGWRLLSSGRFAHTKSHVVNAGLAAGYKLIMYKEIVPRMERGEEVRGHLFAFQLDTKDEL